MIFSVFVCPSTCVAAPKAKKDLYYAQIFVHRLHINPRFPNQWIPWRNSVCPHTAHGHRTKLTNVMFMYCIGTSTSGYVLML